MSFLDVENQTKYKDEWKQNENRQKEDEFVYVTRRGLKKLDKQQTNRMMTPRLLRKNQVHQSNQLPDQQHQKRKECLPEEEKFQKPAETDRVL